MDRPVVAEKSVLESVLEWSLDRSAWQRDALRRIVTHGKLSDDDFRELADLCKLGRGAKPGPLAPVPLAQAHLPANPDHDAAVTLLSVGNATGANNLAPDQTITFEPQGLTIVYGDNGAGKSGYARILKRACRARHAGKIEPNVYDEKSPKSASADISFAVAGAPQASMRWQDGPQPHAMLSAISVFDSDCASVHVKEKNEVAFRPFGLDVPDELAHACQEVKDLITTEQKQLEKARNPIFAAPTWKATTTVGKTLAALSAGTDIKAIEGLAKLTDDETLRLERLRDDLAKNPAKASAEQTLKADNVKRVIDAVKAINSVSTDDALVSLAAAFREARIKRGAARVAAERAFGAEAVAGVGGEIWRELWESAKRYSVTTAFPEQPFPPSAADAHCVLCLQPLSQDAINRMARFEEFIQQDTELQAQKAERAARDARLTASRVRMQTLEYKAALDEIGLRDAALRQSTRRFIASARLRRFVLLRSLGAENDEQLPPTVPSPLAALIELEVNVRKYAEELRQAAGAEERKKLESELAELNDRALLAGILPTVIEEVERLKSIQFLTGCLTETTTNAITKFGNEVADTVITPKMRDRFQDEIVKLAAEKVRVEIVRSGGKYGSPQYQVRLFAKPDAKVHDVLSEGERTCVALAAFLTELATAAHQSALVFDDPVSSLDHRWRGKVAERLANEATRRQVIVFTHDLVFVNDLLDRAQANGVALRLVTLSRGPTGAGQVADGLPWKAQSVEDRLDRLEKAARAAKLRYENNEEEAYESAAIKIYDHLRATWERGLEDIAFSRVVQRHRDYINAKDLKKVSVLTEADCEAFAAGFKKCCDIVDAHDPSRGRNASAPPPSDLLQDIQALKDWVASLRDRQKRVA
ncbi:AAA family ATPase [Burkholderia multivorans]|uniref:DNA repair protein n=2 Tax=Burkholderia multivorans TaxID=87883 RepID=A0A2S9M6E3_9BURK|nr:ATP-binding protein [Burkholderia multivorans]MBU9147146.1 AAA family ATPase [Burkholderia multivorans]MBU9528746.1 AAA family ATPase [Burkholderia multivorans]MBU9541068.1 AAA family ATPase [Burkholderia multivorans]PRF52012.1 DNA repair protein [Burkholderia multivorans]